jgi:hypothetical protein
MAVNCGLQILNVNFTAEIGDYELEQPFINDLVTSRIGLLPEGRAKRPGGSGHMLLT